jgi:hypothetical protein
MKPPVATWNDATATSEAQGSLDARLITDHTGGARSTDDRTIVEQLAGPNSIQAYTDDNGAGPNPPHWTSSTGGGFPSGVDHQSIGAGRYASGSPLPFPTPVYPHAVYYCSQDVATSFCARSDDGGATYGTGVQVYTTLQCGGLHGKPRVGPDGTVYLPNKNCTGSGGTSAAKGVAVSQNDGLTWTVHNIPSTQTDSNQPDSDVAVGGNSGLGTVYYAYRDGDHHPKVVVSNDDGNTWSTPFDVGAAFSIQNAQFPEVIAGDQNRAAVTFIGTITPGSDIPDNFSDNRGPAVWYLYVALTYDGGQTWQTVNATPNDPVQRGGVCLAGTGCTGSDRNMLDFNDSTIDNQGRVQVAYTDGCSGACETDPNAAACNAGASGCTGTFSSIFSMVNQVCGMGLFAKYDPGFDNDPICGRLAASIPEVGLVVDIGAVGLLATGLGLFFHRRRRKTLRSS